MNLKKLFKSFLFVVIGMAMTTSVSAYELTDTHIADINALLKDTAENSGAPGISVAIVDGQKTKFLSYGFADKEHGIEVTKDTYFELASVSKAYTALGILLLEDEGKLNLNDPIQKYIPWFEVCYQNEPLDMNKLTIANFMYHTSGLTNSSHLALIPMGTSDDMLKKTVEALVGANLDFAPFEKFTYGTVNYDILGLVIENITGQLYEDFMKEQIFKPLGLDSTFVYEEDARAAGQMAIGYRPSYLLSAPYDAPVYRGNKPAGYIISNAEDMSRWLKIHMGLIEVPNSFSRILKRAHEGDKTVAPVDENYYAAGWSVSNDGSIIQHEGNNPSFLTNVYMLPKQGIAICVLTNATSADPIALTSNIINILDNKPVVPYSPALNKTLDLIFTVITAISSILSLLFIMLIVVKISQVRNIVRQYVRPTIGKRIPIMLSLILMVFVVVVSLIFPSLMGHSWSTIIPWIPNSGPICFIVLSVTSILAFVQVLLAKLYPKKLKGKS